MKTILVTGAAGFIGSNLIQALLDAGHRVVGVDNFDDTYDIRFKEEHLAPFLSHEHFQLYRADVRDAEALAQIFTTERPAYVAHLAAKADTRDAVNMPRIYTSVNIDGTLNVLELCKQFSVENTIIASSSSVYGNSPRVPWKEDESADRPLSPYGATKRSVELIAYTYHHNFGLNVTCLRYFNAYGENNRPGMVPYVWGLRLLRGEEIEISGDGRRKRDYTYIGDIVRGTVLAMGKPLGYEIINLGNSAPVSLNELLALFEDVLGVQARVKSRPSAKASVEATCADISKASALLGWEPKTSLRDGLMRLVDWLRTNRLQDRK